MLKVYLVISMMAAGSQPSMSLYEEPDLKTCWVHARKWMEEHKGEASRATPAVGVGCAVQFKE